MRKTPEPIAAFRPSTPLTPAQRGDTGRGPLPKNGCGDSRFVSLKSPGKGKGGSVQSAEKHSGSLRMTLAQKGSGGGVTPPPATPEP